MKKLQLWLENHRSLNGMLAVVFFLAIVVFHDEVTVLALELRKAISLKSYNLLFALSSIALFLIWIAALYRYISRRSSLRIVSFFVIPTFLLIALSFVFLQTFTIEAVHFFQYAILAFLLFPLVKSYGATVFWTTLLGILDEIHQYVVLTPQFKYFDFNDILLNMLGAGLAISTLFLIIGQVNNRQAILRSVRFAALTGFFIAASFALAYLAGKIRWYPEADLYPDWFTINRTDKPDSFWTEAYKGSWIHVIDPKEGPVSILILMIWYSLPDLLPLSYFFPKKYRKE